MTGQNFTGPTFTGPTFTGNNVILVLGGARSGKSRYAEQLALSRPPPRLYVATAAAHDAEMVERIREHKQRRGPAWTTLEAPLELAEVLRRHGPGPNGTLLVDCLTLWLANLMEAGRDIDAATKELVDTCGLGPNRSGTSGSDGGTVIFVANEVGLGIVPNNALARAFRDHAGRLNQAMAARADRVVFIAAGLALPLKGPPIGLEIS